MTEHEKRCLRARIGLHLAGAMPTIAGLRREFRLGRSAACRWHAMLAKARREFATWSPAFDRSDQLRTILGDVNAS